MFGRTRYELSPHLDVEYRADLTWTRDNDRLTIVHIEVEIASYALDGAAISAEERVRIEQSWRNSSRTSTIHLSLRQPHGAGGARPAGDLHARRRARPGVVARLLTVGRLDRSEAEKTQTPAQRRRRAGRLATRLPSARSPLYIDVMSAPPLLSLTDIALGWGGKPLFTGVTCAVGRGDRLALVGRNGSGKSTLLKVLAGLIDADSGERFTQPGAKVVYLPQEPDLAGFATLGDYAAADLDPSERYKAEMAMEALEVRADVDPNAASGGEGRRAALARVLAAEA